MIKRICIYLLFVLSVWGCSKPETDPTPDIPEPGEETIVFTPAVRSGDNLGTPVLNNNLPAGSFFGVMGFACSDGTWYGTETPRYMYNTKMTDGGNYADPSLTKYWPDGGMRFMAYYPYTDQSASGNAVTLTGIDDQGYPTITYTTSADPARQIDLLGYMTPGVVTKTTGRIPLVFQHLLTRVTFTGQATGETDNAIVVTRIKLMNVYPQSTFTFTDTEAPADTPGTWSAMQGAPMDFIVFKGELALGENLQVITDASQAMMLVPQPLTGIKIQVDYTINNTNFSKSIDLSATSATFPWIPGRSVNYELDIRPAKAVITLTITSAVWTQINIDTDLQ